MYFVCLTDGGNEHYHRDSPRSSQIWADCVPSSDSQAAAGHIVNMLWQLMENSLEELKLLQTVLVLLTTNTVVHDEALSKVRNLLNWCLRTHWGSVWASRLEDSHLEPVGEEQLTAPVTRCSALGVSPSRGGDIPLASRRCCCCVQWGMLRGRRAL